MIRGRSEHGPGADDDEDTVITGTAADTEIAALSVERVSKTYGDGTVALRELTLASRPALDADTAITLATPGLPAAASGRMKAPSLGPHRTTSSSRTSGRPASQRASARASAASRP